MGKRRGGREADNAYAREWYRRIKNTPMGEAMRAKKREYRKNYYPEYYKKNREKVIAAVRERKINEYGGNCVICGKGTMGKSKRQPGPDYCINHRKEQWVAKRGMPKRELQENRTEEEKEKKRQEWREAQKRYREKKKALKGATPGAPKSKRRSAVETPQERLAGATRKQQSFSRLTRNGDRGQDETNESPPAPRKWASP